jgi:hypothetical protein
MRARGARAPARPIVQLIFPTSTTDKNNPPAFTTIFFLKISCEGLVDFLCARGARSRHARACS